MQNEEQIMLKTYEYEGHGFDQSLIDRGIAEELFVVTARNKFQDHYAVISTFDNKDMARASAIDFSMLNADHGIILEMGITRTLKFKTTDDSVASAKKYLSDCKASYIPLTGEPNNGKS